MAATDQLEPFAEKNRDRPVVLFLILEEQARLIEAYQDFLLDLPEQRDLLRSLMEKHHSILGELDRLKYQEQQKALVQGKKAAGIVYSSNAAADYDRAKAERDAARERGDIRAANRAQKRMDTALLVTAPKNEQAHFAPLLAMMAMVAIANALLDRIHPLAFFNSMLYERLFDKLEIAIQASEDSYIQKHRDGGKVLVQGEWVEWNEESHAEPLRRLHQAIVKAMRNVFQKGLAMGLHDMKRNSPIDFAQEAKYLLGFLHQLSASAFSVTHGAATFIDRVRAFKKVPKIKALIDNVLTRSEQKGIQVHTKWNKDNMDSASIPVGMAAPGSSKDALAGAAIEGVFQTLRFGELKGEKAVDAVLQALQVNQNEVVPPIQLGGLFFALRSSKIPEIKTFATEFLNKQFAKGARPIADFRRDLADYLISQFPKSIAADTSLPHTSPVSTRKSPYAKKTINDATIFLQQDVFPGCAIGYHDPDPQKAPPKGKYRVEWSPQWSKGVSSYKIEYVRGTIPDNGIDFLVAVLESKPHYLESSKEVDKIKKKIQAWRDEAKQGTLATRSTHKLFDWVLGKRGTELVAAPPWESGTFMRMALYYAFRSWDQLDALVGKFLAEHDGYEEPGVLERRYQGILAIIHAIFVGAGMGYFLGLLYAIRTLVVFNPFHVMNAPWHVQFLYAGALFVALPMVASLLMALVFNVSRHFDYNLRNMDAALAQNGGRPSVLDTHLLTSEKITETKLEYLQEVFDQMLYNGNLLKWRRRELSEFIEFIWSFRPGMNPWQKAVNTRGIAALITGSPYQGGVILGDVEQRIQDLDAVLKHLALRNPANLNGTNPAYERIADHKALETRVLNIMQTMYPLDPRYRMTMKVIPQPVRKNRPPREVSEDSFTQKQIEVIAMLAKGWSKKRMANTLQLTKSPIRDRLNGIKRILGMEHSQMDAVVLALYSKGYMPTPPSELVEALQIVRNKLTPVQATLFEWYQKGVTDRATLKQKISKSLRMVHWHIEPLNRACVALRKNFPDYTLSWRLAAAILSAPQKKRMSFVRHAA